VRFVSSIPAIFATSVRSFAPKPKRDNLAFRRKILPLPSSNGHNVRVIEGGQQSSLCHKVGSTCCKKLLVDQQILLQDLDHVFVWSCLLDNPGCLELLSIGRAIKTLAATKQFDPVNICKISAGNSFSKFDFRVSKTPQGMIEGF